MNSETTAPRNPLFTFEADLDAGTLTGCEVEVRWTNNFSYHRAIAKVIKVNRSSVRVTVVRACKEGESGAYLVGRTLSFPRLLANKWSQNNGAFYFTRCEAHSDCALHPDLGIECAKAVA